jgi:hypothetical protein
MVVWQLTDGELRKWVQRPLHHQKRNFWWCDVAGGEIEIRHVAIDPQQGFFATEEEAIDCFIGYHTKKLEYWENRREKYLETPRIKESGIYYHCDQWGMSLGNYDDHIAFHTKQIIAARERRATLAGARPSNGGF